MITPLRRTPPVTKIVPLSNLHNANEASERARFRTARPFEEDVVQCMHVWQDPKTGRLYHEEQPGLEKVETACYVKGVLQPTRAFGDFALKCPSLNVTLGSFEAAMGGAGLAGAGKRENLDTYSRVLNYMIMKVLI